MIRDLFNIINKCIAYMSGGEFSVAILIAVLLGALCWVACSYYTRLWHRRFHVRPQHHLLCAVAALLTVVFTVQYRAVGNLEYVVDHIIDDWYEHLTEDREFHSDTYELAFYTLKEDYPAAFGGVPTPGSNDSYIPFANDAMMQTCVEIYVDEACANFSTQHPFLNMMLKARPGISQDEIEQDIREFFRRNPGTRYPLGRAVDIAANHIRESLLEQSPKTVWKTRLILVFLFLGVQLVPFGIITYCANEDLKRGRYKAKREEEFYY